MSKFIAINLFGTIIFKKNISPPLSWKQYNVVVNHESIHTAQMKELLYIGFYILYGLEWIFRVIFHTKTAYRGLSFEREAYDNQKDLTYLTKRKHFAEFRKNYGQS